MTLYDGGNPANVYKSVGQLEFAHAADGRRHDRAGDPSRQRCAHHLRIRRPPGATPGVAAGNVAVTIVGGDLAQTVANLIAAIGTNPSFGSAASGMNTVALKADSTSTILLAGGSNAAGADFAIDASGCSATRQSLLQSPSFTISKQGAPTPPAVTLAPAIAFNADGLPKAFGVGKMAVDGFVSGAASMDGTSASQITLDFGSLGEADGITQLSAEFTPTFIEQDGARFGVFSGVTISSDGLVSALFDNGERRPIYRVPLVTFVNPDGLEAQTGNVWNTTEASGNPTLRVAEFRTGRSNRAVLVGGLDRRYRRRIHRHDRRAEGVLGCDPDHQHGRRDAGGTRAHQTISGLAERVADSRAGLERRPGRFSAAVNLPFTRRLLGSHPGHVAGKQPAHPTVGEAMETLRNFVRTLGAVRLTVLGGVAFALIGFFVWIIARASVPQQALLYGDLDMADAARVVSQLEASAIPYHLGNGGTSVYVAADQVARTRVALAEHGLPSGGSVGYEIFDAGESLGTTNFQQNLNLVRALEGELGRTIRSIDTVKAARVHLVLPRRELFSREKPEASASVLLQMRGRMRLTPAQVTAVQHLIASAVSGLTPSRISIVDGQGTLLTEGTDGSDAVALAAGKADQRRRELENHLSRTVEQLLERIVGAGKVRAEVSADIDFDRINTSEEIFDPDGQVVRSTQSVEQKGSNTDGRGSPPVSVATNLPDANLAPAGAGAGSSSSENRSEETVNYEISKKVVNHVREAGRHKAALRRRPRGWHVRNGGGRHARVPASVLRRARATDGSGTQRCRLRHATRRQGRRGQHALRGCRTAG